MGTDQATQAVKSGQAIGSPWWILSPGAFRLCLAMAVFVNHTLPLQIGSGAVYLFFMLSGYWVFRMWHAQYRHTRQPVLTFVISRLWRLLPMYYVGLAALIAVLAIGAAPHFHGPAGLSWQSLHFYLSHAILLFYATLPPEQRWFLPVWSLDIELQFYVVAPLLFTLLLSSQRRIAGYLIFAIATLGLIDFLIFYGGIRAQGGMLPMYLAFFLVGVQTARREWRPAPVLALAGIAAAAVLCAACVALPQTRSLMVTGSFSGWLSDYNPHANVVLAGLMAPYAMSTLRQTRLIPIWMDRHLGNITYDVYLLHWSAAVALLRFAGDISAYRRLPLIVLAWIVVPILAALVYVGIDRPIDALRVRFVKSRKLQSSRPEKRPLIDAPAAKQGVLF